MPFLAFFAAATFFTTLGLPLARAMAPRGMPALGMAPALGWAVFVALALPVLGLVGFGRFPFLVLAAGALMAAFAHWGSPAARLPRWSLALAAGLAVLPLLAILPKAVPGGILLAPPMFDHVKIAIVDAILRDGLPVPNPFIGPDALGHLAYYYLWHAGAAMLAAALGVDGWTAEAAMTGFTAFSALTLMMGVTAALGGRAVAVAGTALLALPGSLRPVLAAGMGADALDRLVPRNADLGGWLNQSAWVPQHLASACCVVLSGLLMQRVAEGQGRLAAVALGICVAAGFESSIWVGGIAFSAGGAALGIVLLGRVPHQARAGLALRGAGAALLAASLIAPVALAEWHAIQLRGGGGLAVLPYPALGAAMPATLRPAANLVAFWPLLLFAFPAILPLCAVMLARRRDVAQPAVLHALGLLAAGCLTTAWLLRSTIDNNDLGWRAVLPALLVAAPCAGWGLERLLAAGRWRLVAVAALVAAMGVPDAVRMARDYAVGQRPGDAAGFAAAAPVWQAVRRLTGPDERIANNPEAVAMATPWPVNIAWATLSDRPSCYSGWETGLAYGTLPKPKLIETAQLFARVFGGQAQPGDAIRMAREDGCAVVVVVPGDGAWARDPFAETYDLVEAQEGWRIYRKK